jgi:F-type H+-transporting ATPase subunit epsilon
LILQILGFYKLVFMSELNIQFELVTPERVVLKETVLQVTIPTELGEITVLPNHIPLVAVLKPGVLEVRRADGSQEVVSVSGGFVEVLHGKIVVLADTAERATELDEARIEEARTKAEALKTSASYQEAVDFADISARLEKELARSRAIKKWKRIKNIETIS